MLCKVETADFFQVNCQQCGHIRICIHWLKCQGQALWCISPGCYGLSLLSSESTRLKSDKDQKLGSFGICSGRAAGTGTD